jgi:IclR family transcriptional regulator, pca regulon regulatory protein
VPDGSPRCQTGISFVGLKQSDYVRSLVRGLAVIRAFGPGRSSMTLSEVAKEAGLTRAAARRFLLTLQELGYVSSDGRVFSLRPRVLELGYAYLSGMSIPEVTRPHLEELAGRVGESCSAAVLDGDDIIYVTRIPTAGYMRITISIGTRLPAYPNSMGRVLLADLDGEALEGYLTRIRLEPLTRHTVADPARLREAVEKVRRDGYAIIDQEMEEDIRAIAVPIRGADGKAVAAINIVAHKSRATFPVLRKDFLPELRMTACEIETDLRALGGR